VESRSQLVPPILMRWWSSCETKRKMEKVSLWTSWRLHILDRLLRQLMLCPKIRTRFTGMQTRLISQYVYSEVTVNRWGHARAQKRFGTVNAQYKTQERFQVCLCIMRSWRARKTAPILPCTQNTSCRFRTSRSGSSRLPFGLQLSGRPCRWYMPRLPIAATRKVSPPIT
jgi:hypothetical protein